MIKTIYKISNVKQNENNNELLEIEFHSLEQPIRFNKQNILEVVKAIICEKERNAHNITDNYINEIVENNDINSIAKLFVGKAIIVAKEDDKVKYITGFNLNAKENSFKFYNFVSITRDEELSK